MIEKRKKFISQLRNLLPVWFREELSALYRREHARTAAPSAPPPAKIGESSAAHLFGKIIKLLGDYIRPMLAYLGAHPEAPENASLAAAVDA